MTRKFHPRSPPRDQASKSGYSHSCNSSPAPSPSTSRRQFPHSSSSPRLHRASGVTPIPNPGIPNRVTHHVLVQQQNERPNVVRVQFTSVHHRNLYLASRPLVLVFDLAGLALHQFFLLLRTLILLIWNPVASIWRNRKIRWSQGQGSSLNLTTVSVETEKGESRSVEISKSAENSGTISSSFGGNPTSSAFIGTSVI